MQIDSSTSFYPRLLQLKSIIQCGPRFSFGRSIAVLATTTLLTVLLTTLGCGEKRKKKESSNAVIAGVLGAISDRGTALTDYRLSGHLVTSVNKEGVHFDYARRAPKLLRLDVKEEKTHMTFDGKTLSVVQDIQKTAVKQSFEGQDPASQIITLHNAFGSFACEGWRPPTLSPKSATATLSKDDAHGPIWTITQPLQDATLKEVRYVLRAPKADFISKETFNKVGDVVAYTRVIEEHTDKGTGLNFPKKWEVKDPARSYTVTLSEIAINKGIPKDTFSATPPDGYKVHVVSGGKAQ